MAKNACRDPFKNIPDHVFDIIIVNLSLAGCFRLACCSKPLRMRITTHLATRKHIRRNDIPSGTFEAQELLDSLQMVKQPHSLVLLISPRALRTRLSNTFPEYLSSLDTLRNVVLLWDEPSCQAYASAPGATVAEGSALGNGVRGSLLAAAAAAIAASRSPIESLTLGGLREPSACDLRPVFAALAKRSPSARPLRELHLVRLETLAMSTLLLLTNRTAPRSPGPRLTPLTPQPTPRPHSAAGAAFAQLSPPHRNPASSPPGLCTPPRCAHDARGLEEAHRSQRSGGGLAPLQPPAPRSVASQLTAISLVECNSIRDVALTPFLEDACSLEDFTLVPAAHHRTLDRRPARHLQPLALRPGDVRRRQGDDEMHVGGMEELHEYALGRTGSEAFLAMFALAANAPRLRSLTLSDESAPGCLDDEDLRPLLTPFSGLQHLHLNVPITDHSVALLAHHCTSLCSLALNHEFVSDVTLGTLLSPCSHLTALSLRGHAASPGAAEATLLALLYSHPALAVLRIEFASVQGPGVLTPETTPELHSSTPETCPACSVDAAQCAVETRGDTDVVSAAATLVTAAASLTCNCHAVTSSHAALCQRARRVFNVQELTLSTMPRSRLRPAPVSAGALYTSLPAPNNCGCPTIGRTQKAPSKDSLMPSSSQQALQSPARIAIPSPLEAILSRTPQLRSLNLSGFRGAIDAVLTLLPAHCCALVRLDLSHAAYLTDSGLRQLLRLPPTLEVLDVSWCPWLNSSAVRDVVKHHLRSLRDLGVWNVDVGGAELLALLSNGRIRRVAVGGPACDPARLQYGLQRMAGVEVVTRGTGLKSWFVDGVVPHFYNGVE